jgi:phosphoglycolate phosphatase
MGYTNLLFDLDGTLTDPCLGITNSIRYALCKFGISEEDEERLKLFIGPPLENSFVMYYNFSLVEAKRAVRYYREYFSVKGMYENKLYDGVPAVLQALKERKKRCFLATSKPKMYAKIILQHFDIEGYFEYVAGSNLDGYLSEKEDLIRHVLEKCELAREETVMIGDRKYDIIGAKKNGIASAGVLYGYGGRGELEEEGADWVCERVEGVLGVGG